MTVWNACYYCGPGVTAHVYWTHSMVDVERHTCFHCGRTRSLDLLDGGWIRVTEDEWLTEPSRLEGAL